MKTTYNKLIGLLTAATIGLTLCSCGGGGGGGSSSKSSSKGSNGGSSETTAMAPELSPGDQIRITVSSTVVDGFTTTEKLTIISDSRLQTSYGSAAYSYKRNGSSATFSYTTAGIHQSFGGAATIYKTIRTTYDLTFTSSTTAKINSLTYEVAIGGTVTERKTGTSGGNATFTIL